VAIAEAGKGPFFFCRPHSAQKQKGKWRNSIRISTLVWLSPTTGWEKRGRAKQKGTKGWAARYSTRFAHRIAIKYLYLYLHFKSALARPPCSGLLARYRRPRATRISGFFVVDYKSLFPSYRSSARTRRAIFAGRIDGKIREYLRFREFTNKKRAIRAHHPLEVILAHVFCGTPRVFIFILS
jgi:hypothetical protein